MKLGPFVTVLAAGLNADGLNGVETLEKQDANSFLKPDAATRLDKANTDGGVEEYRAPNLERECNEEVCDYEEAFEIFGDKTRTDDFMHTRLHQCEITTPCFVEGSKDCVNKWSNYWCECKNGFYGKDCDFIDTRNGYMCNNPNGCANMMPGAVDNGMVPETTTIKQAQTKTVEPKVNCDVRTNTMTIELPSWRLGEMKMGLDMFTAQCGPTQNTTTEAIYTYKFDECGTRVIEEDGNFVYENHIGRLPLKINGVYRDLGMTYNVRCIIDRHGHVDNRFVNETTGETGGEIVPIYTMPDKVFLEEDEEAKDKYIFRLNIYHTEQYLVKYQLQQFPLSMLFKDEVYLGVEVLTAMDHQYIYTDSCWATPTADPLHRAQVYYPIMDKGCPSDVYTGLEPRLDLEDRFKTETFKFPDQDYVYIQCDVLVCDLNVPNDPECQSTCRAPVGPQKGVVSRSDMQLNGRVRRDTQTSTKPRQIVTVGPLRVHKTTRSESAVEYSMSNIASWVIAGGALAALTGFVVYTQKKKATEVEPIKA